MKNPFTPFEKKLLRECMQLYYKFSKFMENVTLLEHKYTEHHSASFPVALAYFVALSHESIYARDRICNALIDEICFRLRFKPSRIKPLFLLYRKHLSRVFYPFEEITSPAKACAFVFLYEIDHDTSSYWKTDFSDNNEIVSSLGRQLQTFCSEIELPVRLCLPSPVDAILLDSDISENVYQLCSSKAPVLLDSAPESSVSNAILYAFTFLHSQFETEHLSYWTPQEREALFQTSLRKFCIEKAFPEIRCEINDCLRVRLRYLSEIRASWRCFYSIPEILRRHDHDAEVFFDSVCYPSRYSSEQKSKFYDVVMCFRSDAFKLSKEQ